ncbi:MAG: RluA family pseudouridine synthase [Chloroflexi bacterium]|jgi:23S rRNA pseudouridine1911/1915/1917 synthase|nr:RluA family pseudouridine synthase [Chloroflexota bacterium]
MKAMEKTFELIVEETGGRLDKYIAEHTELSRAHIQKLIREEKVLVGGNTAMPKRGITINERITITVPPPEPIEIEPENIPLNIVYEDNDIIVIDKPAGLTVHPAVGNWTGTLVNAVLAHCPDLAGIKGSLRPGIVHRLDKDTSGLMVVAKNDTAQLSLSTQIKNREITKGYLAMVTGHLTPQEGAIEGPVGRHPKDRKKMAIVTTGRKARTVYKVQEYVVDCTLLEISPETGRTHQIRVHLSSIGYPVVGDVIYGGKSKLITRQFLHAYRLGFRLPSNGEYVEFESVLPDDLSRALERAR